MIPMGVTDGSKSALPPGQTCYSPPNDSIDFIPADPMLLQCLHWRVFHPDLVPLLLEPSLNLGSQYRNVGGDAEVEEYSLSRGMLY